MKRYLIFIIFSVFPMISQGQENVRSGYIVSNENDTIYGWIKVQSDMRNCSECVFEADSNGFVTFQPFEIQAYRITDDRYYVSRELVDKGQIVKLFAEYLVQGERDLLYFRDMNGSHYLISLNEKQVAVVPFEERYLTKDNKQYVSKSTDHIGLLKTYFSDCPEIFGDIDKIQEPGRSNMVNLTKKYHRLSCGEDACIVYGKKKYPFKMAVNPVYGLTMYNPGSIFYTVYGGNLHFWLPNANENLYFKVGCQLLKSEEPGNLIRIPIQFEYQLPYKYVKPKFSAGVDVLAESGLGIMFVSSGTGALVRLTNNFYLDLNLEAELISMDNFKWLLPSLTISGGIYLQF